MATQRKVLVVGSINVDCTVKVSTLPTGGETIHGSEPQFLPGGKGGNQAVSVANNGTTAFLISAVGTDTHGKNAIKSLESYGVNTQGVATKETSTGTAFIFVENSGENLIVVTAGANGLVTPAEVQKQIHELGGDQPVVLCQLELPIESVKAAAKTAQELGGRFILNLAPAEKIEQSLVAMCDPIVVNETEAMLLTGKNISSIDDAKALVVEIAKQAKSAVITLGADGAVFAEQSSAEATHSPSEKVSVVDTTGAGDAFVGALAAAFSRGEVLATAVADGLIAGAKAVQHFGAQPPRG